MIDAVILALIGSGLLALFLDYFDKNDIPNMRKRGPDQNHGTKDSADDCVVKVTDINQLIGRFDQNG